MRADLTALVNAPPVSAGHELQFRQMILAWLALNKWAPSVTQNVINLQSKMAAMQGLTDDAFLNLRIQGLATQQGLSAQTFPQLLASARAAINGQGVSNPPTQSMIISADFDTLWKYSILTAVGILNDAS